MSLEKLIGDLLLRHSCVVLPGLGGFVARVEPARLLRDKGSILPPSKSILFNRQLLTNDGLLIAAFAKEAVVPYSEAEVEVNSTLKQWKNNLSSGERIAIDRVGFLFQDEEGHIAFQQDRSFNLLLQSFGLSAVHFIAEEDVIVTLAQAVPQEDLERFRIEHHVRVEKQEEGVFIQAVDNETKVVSIGKNSSWKKVARYAAAVAFVPIAFYAYWIPMKTPFLESGVLALHDFNPWKKYNEERYKKRAIQLPKIFKETSATFDEEVNLLDEHVSTFTVEFADVFFPVKIREESKVEPQETTENQGNYHLIIGCFSQRSNAENLVKELQKAQVSAYIVDEVNGMTRVSAGNANSMNAINALKEQLGEKGNDTWVLVK